MLIKKSFNKFKNVCLHKYQSKKHITNVWALSEKTMYLLHKKQKSYSHRNEFMFNNFQGEQSQRANICTNIRYSCMIYFCYLCVKNTNNSF